ncbi:hypothetical protein [Rasiella sp. SM2506]|uniref:hypothetical protein n=1 Tax=Rasiella sp. SM2506 TaxID=3423914 RepID=UPI003D7B8E48
MKKIIVFFLLVSVLFSCSKDDDTLQDQNFQIDFTDVNVGQVNISVSGLTAIEQVVSSGLVWGVIETPDIETNDFVLNSVVSGSFQDTIYGLRRNTIYNFRAFQQTKTSINYGPVFSITTLGDCTGEIFQGDVILLSQKDVDDFDIVNICAINGSLQFTSEDILDPIIDISKFSNVSGSVQSLQIFNNVELKNLSGLQNITSVEDLIYIGGNRELTDIDELSSINGGLDYVSIVNNQSLTHLNGLRGITKIGNTDGGLEIRGNYNLNTLGTLDALEELQNFNLVNNPSLISFELPSLKGTIQNFILDENGGLKTVPNLGELNVINNLDINDCFLLENLDGLQPLQNVENIVVSGSKLENLNFLSNVIAGSYASFYANDMLSDYCGLQRALQNGSFINFETNSNAFNPTREDVFNGNCLL